MDKLHYIKDENFFSVTKKKVKRQATNWEKILHPSESILVRIHKKLLQISKKMANSLKQKWAKVLNTIQNKNIY